MTLVEDIVVFCNGQPKYFPIMTDQKPRISKNYINNKKGQYGAEKSVASIRNQKYPRQIIEISNANQKGKAHPTQKPIALMEYLIKTYTIEGETILDFAAGSGITAIACERLKRKWTGIEISEKYCEIAAKRIEQERKQLKLF
jgi:DNA modification methylase